MNVVFFCRSCGARFEVEPRMAGRRGRCRKCGQHTTIPAPEELASMPAMPAVAPAPTPAANVARRAGRKPAAVDAPAPSFSAWLKAGISQVGLAPVSSDRIPVRPILPPAIGEAAEDDSRPYAVGAPMVVPRGKPGFGENAALRLWRRQIGTVQKVFRWLNESAYFVSIPFVMILLFGTAVKNRPIALFGATFVVLLNLGRIAAGAANLAMVPLRDGLDARKYRKPARRVAEPVLTIVAVVLGFTFIPWLRPGHAAGGSLAHRLRAGATGLEKEIAHEAGDILSKARGVDFGRLGTEARRRFEAAAEGGGTEKP